VQIPRPKIHVRDLQPKRLQPRPRPPIEDPLIDKGPKKDPPGGEMERKDPPPSKPPIHDPPEDPDAPEDPLIRT